MFISFLFRKYTVHTHSKKENTEWKLTNKEKDTSLENKGL